MHLEYDGGSVYVPVYRIGAVHRYLGGEAGDVKLDKLGGADLAGEAAARLGRGEARSPRS